MSNRSLIALLFAIGMVVWLFSGDLSSNSVTADEQTGDLVIDTAERPLVRGIKSVASQRDLFLDVRGQTKANRIVKVKSEIAGVIEQVPGEKGKHVQAGDLLCQVAIDTRRSDLSEAVANLKSAQLEYDGIRDLSQRGLQSDITLAKAKAILEQSRSRAKRAELALQKTRIVAPFAGVVEDQPVEIGDFLSPGSICVTIIEIDPILVAGQVAEKDIANIQLGDKVQADLITGQHHDGIVTFIGRSPDATTRTFPVEVTIENTDQSIRAGLTSTMRVPIGSEPAHLISPASLVLNDDGLVGVRLVDEQNIVHFHVVKIVNEGTEGVWVTGLPEQANIITVGQEDVFEGQLVDIDFAPLAALVGS